MSENLYLVVAEDKTEITVVDDSTIQVISTAAEQGPPGAQGIQGPPGTTLVPETVGYGLSIDTETGVISVNTSVIATVSYVASAMIGYATETFVSTSISTASSNYATVAQGTLADSALQSADLIGYATETYVDNAINAFTILPADATGTLLNDGNGNLSWGTDPSSTTMSTQAVRSTNFTLAASDNNYIIPVDANVVVSVPSDLPSDFAVVLIQYSVTPFSVTALGGVVINSPHGLQTTTQFDSLSLIKMADGTFLATRIVGTAVSELSDVYISNLNDGDVLSYDQTNSRWQNSVPTGGTGGSGGGLVKTVSGDRGVTLGYILPNLIESGGASATYDMTVNGLVTVHWTGHGLTALHNGMGIQLQTREASALTNEQHWAGSNPLGIRSADLAAAHHYYFDHCTNFTYVDVNTFTCQATLTQLPLAAPVVGVSFNILLADLRNFNNRSWAWAPAITIPAGSMGPNGMIDVFSTVSMLTNYPDGAVAYPGAANSWFVANQGFAQSENIIGKGFISGDQSPWTGGPNWHGVVISNTRNIRNTNFTNISARVVNMNSQQIQFKHGTNSSSGIYHPDQTMTWPNTNGLNMSSFQTYWDTSLDTVVTVSIGFTGAPRPEVAVVWNSWVSILKGA